MGAGQYGMMDATRGRFKREWLMSDFVDVARVNEVPEGRGKMFVAGGREIALFRVDGHYYALDDCCPHMGASLALGNVRDGMVICDRHLWAFRLSDGTCPDAPTLKATSFEVRVQGDRVQVRIAEPEEAL